MDPVISGTGGLGAREWIGGLGAAGTDRLAGRSTCSAGLMLEVVSTGSGPGLAANAGPLGMAGTSRAGVAEVTPTAGRMVSLMVRTPALDPAAMLNASLSLRMRVPTITSETQTMIAEMMMRKSNMQRPQRRRIESRRRNIS